MCRITDVMVDWIQIWVISYKSGEILRWMFLSHYRKTKLLFRMLCTVYNAVQRQKFSTHFTDDGQSIWGTETCLDITFPHRRWFLDDKSIPSSLTKCPACMLQAFTENLLFIVVAGTCAVACATDGRMRVIAWSRCVIGGQSIVLVTINRLRN